MREHGEVASVDSRQCPAMSEELEKLDERPLDWTLDFIDLGPGSRLSPPPPHATWTNYTMRIATPAGGRVAVTGWSPDLDAAMRPLLNAIDRCEREQGAEG